MTLDWILSDICLITNLSNKDTIAVLFRIFTKVESLKEAPASRRKGKRTPIATYTDCALLPNIFLLAEKLDILMTWSKL